MRKLIARTQIIESKLKETPVRMTQSRWYGKIIIKQNVIANSSIYSQHSMCLNRYRSKQAVPEVLVISARCQRQMDRRLL